MSTLVIKARVCLNSEERIDNLLLDEASQEFSEKDRYVVWRKIALPISLTRKVVQYNREKSMLLTYEGDILVDEPFESLEPRWSVLMDEYEKSTPEDNEFQEEIENGGGDEEEE